MAFNLEEVNKATGFIADARRTLDENVRIKTIHESLLGELTHLEILEKSLLMANKGLEILSKEAPLDYDKYKGILNELENEIEKYKPKPVKEVEEKPVFKPRVARGRKKL